MHAVLVRVFPFSNSARSQQTHTITLCQCDSSLHLGTCVFGCPDYFSTERLRELVSANLAGTVCNVLLAKCKEPTTKMEALTVLTHTSQLLITSLSTSSAPVKFGTNPTDWNASGDLALSRCHGPRTVRAPSWHSQGEEVRFLTKRGEQQSVYEELLDSHDGSACQQVK